MACECLDEMDKLLADKNTRLERTFGFPRDGRPAYMRPAIGSEKIEPRKRTKSVLVLPTFCPFCGVRYEPAEGAAA